MSSYVKEGGQKFNNISLQQLTAWNVLNSHTAEWCQDGKGPVTYNLMI